MITLLRLYDDNDNNNNNDDNDIVIITYAAIARTTDDGGNRCRSGRDRNDGTRVASPARRFSNNDVTKKEEKEGVSDG